MISIHGSYWSSRGGLAASQNIPGVSRGVPATRPPGGNDFDKCPQICFLGNYTARSWQPPALDLQKLGPVRTDATRSWQPPALDLQKFGPARTAHYGLFGAF